MVKNINNFLIEMRDKFVVIFFVIITIVISIVYNILLSAFKVKTEVDNMQFYESIIEVFLFAVVLAPIIETFLFLYLFFQFLKTKLNSKNIILFSALCFSLIHYPKNFSVTETLNVFIVGLILGYAYKIFLCKRLPPFWYVVAIHACINFIGIMIYFFLPEVTN